VIEHSLAEGKCVFKVQVVPRSARTEIVGEYNGALRVRIAAPPVDGAANDELIRILAKTFKVARSSVKIINGQSARVKRVCVEGARTDVAAALSAWG
jgi:uncharacterized protein